MQCFGEDPALQQGVLHRGWRPRSLSCSEGPVVVQVQGQSLLSACYTERPGRGHIVQTVARLCEWHLGRPASWSSRYTAHCQWMTIVGQVAASREFHRMEDRGELCLTEGAL